jgi:hypothetical protein
VANLIKHFEATGSVKDLARPGRPRSIRTEENRLLKLLSAEEASSLQTFFSEEKCHPLHTFV